MSGMIPNMIVSGGTTIRLPVRKKVAETRMERAARVAAFAMGQRYKAGDFFAMRYDREWHIYQIHWSQPQKSGLTEDAAAMWLLHRSAT
jgi:hypothetical protein